MSAAASKIIKAGTEAGYTAGWRARRDGRPREGMNTTTELMGWDDANHAAACCRNIWWSKGSDDIFVEVPSPVRRLVQP